MCTVTYIPDENNGFLVAHNRDERIDRPVATPPLLKRTGNIRVIYPLDPEGKGTWTGMSSDGRVASLLNGGSKKHFRKPTYKHSRGLIIPAYFSCPDLKEFAENYDFEGLEPFTLVVIEKERMFVATWEDETLTIEEKNRSIPHIFFSHSLYPAASHENRAAAFYQWFLDKKAVSEKELLKFNLGQRFELGEIEKFDTGNHILKTVSISIISNNEKSKMHFLYYDAVNDVKLSNSFSGVTQPMELQASA